MFHLKKPHLFDQKIKFHILCGQCQTRKEKVFTLGMYTILFIAREKLTQKGFSEVYEVLTHCAQGQNFPRFTCRFLGQKCGMQEINSHND